MLVAISTTTLHLAETPTSSNISVDGVFAGSFAQSGANPITLDGGDGDDTLTIDFSGGYVLPAQGITFNGGVGGNDAIDIANAPSGNAIFNYTNATDGSVVIPGAGTINYTGLDPLTYSSSGGTLTFNLTAGNDDITVSTSGSNLILSGATIETTTVSLTSVTAIIVNGGGGADKVTVNNALTQNVTLNVGEVVLNAPITGTVSGTANIVTVNAGGLIQNGINVASIGATVNVAAGTYNEDVDLSSKPGLQLFGAGAASTTISAF